MVACQWNCRVVSMWCLSRRRGSAGGATGDVPGHRLWGRHCTKREDHWGGRVSERFGSVRFLRGTRQPEARHSDPAARCGHTHTLRHRRRSCEQAATPPPRRSLAGQGRGGKGGGGRGHVPTEISEFFVNALESHGMVWCGVVDLVVVVVLWLMCCAESWAEQDVKASGVAVAVAAARTWHGTSS